MSPRPLLRAAVLAAGLAALGCESVGQVVQTVQIPGAAGTALQTAFAVAPLVPGALVDLDEPEEIELGRAVTANVGSRYRLLRDPVLTRYVALVGNTVAAHSERPDLAYRFAVLDTAEVNAFAAPGGFVFITRGALGLMRDEAMLAGVLGHEVAHVALRHGVETVKAEKRKRLAMVGVQQGVRATSAAPFAGLIAAGADVVAEQVVLKGFSRAEESEADHAGARYAVAAGYDGAGLRDFLHALVARGNEDPNASRFFSTHPATAERVTEQDGRLREGPRGGRRNTQRFAAAVR